MMNTELNNISFPSNIQEWLDLLKNNVVEQRYAISHSSKALEDTYKQAIKLNALNILVPHELGGAGLDLTAQYYYHKYMAMASGTLAFFCGQHIGAMAMIANGCNHDFKE